MNNQLIIKESHFNNFDKLLNERKFTNCLIVTSNGNIKRDYHKPFVDLLKENKCSYIIQKINNYPTLLDIETMFKNVEQIDIDLVISIGGGSSIDIAKLYSSCILNEENLINVSQLLNRKPQDCIFSVAVPTTAGSGAESTKFATIWSKKSKEKLSFENENLIPNYVYLIPEYTTSLSYELTLTTTLDSLCHCIDSILNQNSNNESISLSVEAINLISENLNLLLNDLNNKNLRTSILNASNLAGKAINISRTSLNHAISYPLTNYYELPHGLACAFSVIETVEYFKNEISDKSYGKYLIKASEAIKNLSLSEIYKQYLDKLDVELITKNTLNNSRYENFRFELNSSVVKEIIQKSKLYYI
tara:strand:- start:15 stop:1097 length:1083 start_codon:yes stop_codon:yes gene_type:complete